MSPAALELLPGNSASPRGIDLVMITRSPTRFILAGSSPENGTFYLGEPGSRPGAWIAYEVRDGGPLANPRPVSMVPSANWRGLPQPR